MLRLRLSPPHDTNQYKELETGSHVFLPRIAIEPPLTAPYDGPYKVIARSGRVFKVMISGKVETVTADRVKPAHIERKPENNSTQQNRVTQKSKPTASKPTATSDGRSKSPTTSKPSKEQNLNARSATQTKEAVPAVTQRSETNAEQSPKPPALYKSPHARSNKFSRANGKKEGLRTYSGIPLHLRSDVPVRIPFKTCDDIRRSDNTDQTSKVMANNLFIKKHVGRQIRTPARFVQLVHAVVAPDNIYGVPSCANHINNS